MTPKRSLPHSTARHLPHSESQINPVHASHNTSWRSILILSSHLSLDHQNGLPPSRLPTKFLYAPLISPHVCYISPHLIFLYTITRIIFGEYRSWSSSLCSLIHSHVTSFLLGPNIFLSTLFSNILILRYDRNIHVKYSHVSQITIRCCYNKWEIIFISMLGDVD